LGGTVGGLIAVTWKPDLNKWLLQNDQHSVAVLAMTIITERERERERETERETERERERTGWLVGPSLHSQQ